MMLLVTGIIVFVLAILSIPLSMSSYLAYDFANTSRSLKRQLKTNHELSQKTIAQAKEKQEILANQNKVLEEQVIARTTEIAKQNTVLEHQKKEITDSINYAKRIQQAFLPAQETIHQYIPGSFILYMPKDIVSGDFYFFEKKDDAVYLAAADCTGHGVPGALMSMIVHEKLNHAVKQYDQPAEILKSINQQVKNALKQHQSEGASRDGCDIALCKITSTELVYSGAFRPLYVFDHEKQLREIKATKTAIAGLTPYNQEFEQSSFQLNEIKAVYFFSDGYADQFGGEKNKKLTTRKFKELLALILDQPIDQQRDTLESFFIEWRSELEQIDDVLVIGINFPRL
jgi:serine phosphatase RsbU (regulator of sigma subunit)